MTQPSSNDDATPACRCPWGGNQRAPCDEDDGTPSPLPSPLPWGFGQDEFFGVQARCCKEKEEHTHTLASEAFGGRLVDRGDSLHAVLCQAGQAVGGSTRQLCTQPVVKEGAQRGRRDTHAALTPQVSQRQW